MPDSTVNAGPLIPFGAGSLGPGVPSVAQGLSVGIPPAGPGMPGPGVPPQMTNPLAQMLAGQGAPYQPGNTNIPGHAAYGLGALPAMHQGESSMAYMLRIGMSPADAQSALEIAKAAPGASFQDIISSGGFNIPGITSAFAGWGQPGDRLERYTPQYGAGGATPGPAPALGGTGGTGSANGGTGQFGPGAGGGGGTGGGAGTGNLGSGAVIGQIPGAGNVQINWGNLQSAMAPPANAPGAPAINQAMQQLQPTYTGPTMNVNGRTVGAGTGTPLPESALTAAQNAVDQLWAQRPARGDKAAQTAWLLRYQDAVDAANAAQGAGRSGAAANYLTGPYVTQG